MEWLGLFIAVDRAKPITRAAVLPVTQSRRCNISAAAIQTLHAQAKPPGYVIAEVNVKDPNGYKKDFLPVIVPIIQAEGGDYLAAGGQTVSFVGAPPPNRVVIVQYESLSEAQEWWGKAKDTLSIGEKYADFTIYAVEGASP